MADHTPTPWGYQRHFSLDGFLIYTTVKTTGLDGVAFVSDDPHSGKQREGNAAFIVRAVNTHADLVSALTGIISNPGGRCTAEQWQAGLAALKKANAP